MRANITHEGNLEITSESELEAYALQQWLRENATAFTRMTKTIYYLSVDGFPDIGASGPISIDVTKKGEGRYVSE